MAIADDIMRYESLMERLAVSYKSRMMAMCRQADLTPPQFWALKTIADRDRTKMSPLADSLGLSLGAASTLVDRLVTRGLVERTTDQIDRRAVHVSASAKGVQVLGEVVELKHALSRQLLAAMPEDTIEQLLAGLNALTLAWESLPPGEPVDTVDGCSL